MKPIIIILFGLMLAGCAGKAPSEVIAQNAIKEIVSVQETVKKIELQTPEECKTDLFMANLESIERQITSIGGQIESIGLSCQTEKEVLEERLAVREMAITCLILIIVWLGYVLMRRK